MSFTRSFIRDLRTKIFGAPVGGAKLEESKKQKLLERVLLKAFIESQFCYYLLIWVFHSRVFNHRISHLHEQSLGVLYQDNISSYEDLLKSDRSFTIHERSIQSHAKRLFKV